MLWGLKYHRVFILSLNSSSNSWQFVFLPDLFSMFLNFHVSPSSLSTHYFNMDYIWLAMTLCTKIIYLLAAFDEMFIHVYGQLYTWQLPLGAVKLSRMKFLMNTFPKITPKYFHLLLEIYEYVRMFNETGILCTNFDIYLLVILGRYILWCFYDLWLCFKVFQT